jgi:hypothetical protein
MMQLIDRGSLASRPVRRLEVDLGDDGVTIYEAPCDLEHVELELSGTAEVVLDGCVPDPVAQHGYEVATRSSDLDAPVDVAVQQGEETRHVTSAECLVDPTDDIERCRRGGRQACS